MLELEKFMKPWKRCVNNTTTFIKPDFITDVIKSLTKFQERTKFTYKEEHNGKISFLEVLLIRSNGKLERTVFCKEKIAIHICIEDFCSYYKEKRYIKDIN